jgi:hypothetical protein
VVLITGSPETAHKDSITRGKIAYLFCLCPGGMKQIVESRLKVVKTVGGHLQALGWGV